MPVAWEEFELAEPTESTINWQDFEPVESEKPKVDQAKVQQLRASQRAAARTGTLANIAGDITDVLTGAATGLTFSPSAIVGQIERGTGLNLGLEQTMRTPIVRIPEISTTKQTPIAGQVGAGVANAVVELANFFLSPEGVSMLGIKALPEAARKAVTASWSGQLLASSPERFNAAIEAVRSGDYATAAKEATAGLGQTAMAGGLGRASMEQIKVPKAPTFEQDLAALAERKALAGTMPARVISPVVTGPKETQLMAAPEPITPPEGMVFEKGPLRKVLPFEMVMLPESAKALAESGGVPVPLPPKVQLETRGKVSFGAPAPVLTRTALGPKEEPGPPREPLAPPAPVPPKPTEPVAQATEAAGGAELSQQPAAPAAPAETGGPSKIVEDILRKEDQAEVPGESIQQTIDRYSRAIEVVKKHLALDRNLLGDTRTHLQETLKKYQSIIDSLNKAKQAGGPSAIEKGTEQEGGKPEYQGTDAQRQATETGSGNRPVEGGVEPPKQEAAQGPLLLDQGKRRKTLKEIREQQNLGGNEAGFINLSVLGDAIDRLRDQISILNSQGKVKAAFTWAKDAAMNKADQYADVVGNGIHNMLRVATKGVVMPTRREVVTGIVKPWKNINELERNALTVAVESFSEMPQGHPEHGIVGRDRLILQQAKLQAYNPPNATMAKWKAKGLGALDFAINNWTRLEPIVRRYDREMKLQATMEQLAGIDTLVRNGYVLHETDLTGESKFDFLTGKSGGENANFLKIRTFPTYIDKIIANDKPKTLDAITLAKRRIQIGQRKINNYAWIDGLKNTVDPTSGSALITRPVVRTRVDGTPQLYPPSNDYVLSRVGNDPVAIHKGYEGAFDALNNPSAFTKSLLGRIAMKGAGTTKHIVLAFDTFHLGRLALWASILQKRPVGYKKGLVLLRNSVHDIQNMARRGEIPREYLNDILENKRQISLAMKTGFNVSRIQDALWQDWVQNVPVTGAFNKWLFGEFQQGAMMQSWLTEFARQKKAFDWMSEGDVARKVSKELNTRFGNLQNQGIFRSKSMQDLARLLFLAPQWNEGLIRSEIGAVTGAGKAVMDAATKRKIAVGALTRSAGILFLAQFAANQLINYATRGHSTLENPEEGLDSKISAYIPDVVGNGPGLFMSPLALPAETAHLIYKRFERNKDFREALLQYGRTRLGTVTRPALMAFTGRDVFGRMIRSEDLWKEIGTATMPVPISAGAGYHAVRQAVTGEKTEQFPGQFQKQAMASVGIKTESAPTASQQIARLAGNWNEKQGKQKLGEYPRGVYEDLDRYLRIGNMVDAAKELRDIRKKHKDDVILQRYEKLPNVNFTHSSEVNESRFLSTLNREQMQLYIKARMERAETLKRFYQLWANRGGSLQQSP